MKVDISKPAESLESLKSERDTTRAELASMTCARNEVQQIAAGHRTEIDLLKAKILEHEKAADADWQMFNAVKTDREEWRRGYHAAIAERDTARKEIEKLQATLLQQALPALGAEGRNALEWLKQLMESITYRVTPHRSALVALANQLLGEDAK